MSVAVPSAGHREGRVQTQMVHFGANAGASEEITVADSCDIIRS